MSRKVDAAKWEAWRRRLRRFDRGAATVAGFCGREGVSVANFYHWRRKLAAEGVAALPAEVRACRSSLGTRTPSRSSTPSRPLTSSRPSADTPGFIAVEITAPSPAAPGDGSCVQVFLPGGARLLVPCHAREAIRVVVAALTTDAREDGPC